MLAEEAIVEELTEGCGFEEAMTQLELIELIESADSPKN